MRTGEFMAGALRSCRWLRVEAWSPGSLRGREKGLGRLRGLFAMTNGRRGQAGLHEGK